MLDQVTAACARMKQNPPFDLLMSRSPPQWIRIPFMDDALCDGALNVSEYELGFNFMLWTYIWCGVEQCPHQATHGEVEKSVCHVFRS